MAKCTRLWRLCPPTPGVTPLWGLLTLAAQLDRNWVAENLAREGNPSLNFSVMSDSRRPK